MLLPINQIFSRFFDRYAGTSSKVLLALSGGPDSLALFHLLLAEQFAKPIVWGVAHVDHRWRPESQSEAEKLRELTERYQIPFHLRTLNPAQMKGNLEECCREERLAFFRHLCQEQGYEAVILGHHADDQAETVLKRLFEGSSLTHLSAMHEVTQWQDLTVWRPLLKASKKMILEWLELQGIEAFQDRTNLETRFMRGKLRTQIMPTLSQYFGKEISSNLCHLSEEALELDHFLSQMLNMYLEKVMEGPLGLYLDLSSNCPESSFALKFLVKKLCSWKGLSISRKMVHTICECILSGKADCSFPVEEYVLQVDRKRIFLMKSALFLLSDRAQPLEVGLSCYGPWTISIEETSESSSRKSSGWLNLWKGCLETVLPFGEYTFQPPILNASISGHGYLGKLWTNDKVPAFLRYLVPVICQGDRLCHEFLTQRSLMPITSQKRCLRITLSYKC